MTKVNPFRFSGPLPPEEMIDREPALRQASPTMRAIWKALPVNERRASRALATLGSPYVGDNAAAVGLNPNSIGTALDGLRDRADIVEAGGTLRLTDPVFELWLQRQGVWPTDESATQAAEGDPIA